MKTSPAHAITNCFWALEKLILATITRQPFRYVDPQKPWKNRTFENCTLKNLRKLYVRQGKRVEDMPTLDEIRNYVKAQLDNEIWEDEQRFENPHRHYLDMTPDYYELKMELLSKTREEHA